MGTSFLADMHADCLCLRKSKTVVSSLLLMFIQTKMQLTFNDTYFGLYIVNLKIIDI